MFTFVIKSMLPFSERVKLFLRLNIYLQDDQPTRDTVATDSSPTGFSPQRAKYLFYCWLSNRGFVFFNVALQTFGWGFSFRGPPPMRSVNYYRAFFWLTCTFIFLKIYESNARFSCWTPAMRTCFLFIFLTSRLSNCYAHVHSFNNWSSGAVCLWRCSLKVDVV